jgi:hypothetical protein
LNYNYKSCLISDIQNLVDEYAGTLSSPFDSFLEDHIGASDFYSINNGEDNIGYFAFNNDGYITQFYMTKGYLKYSQTIFKDILNKYKIKHALVFTGDELFLSLVLDQELLLKKQAYFFQDSGIVIEESELAYWIVELEDGDDEGQKSTRGKHAVSDLPTTQQQKKRNSDRTKDVHQGRTYGGGSYRTQIRIEESARRRSETVRFPRFHAEGFHNPIAGDRFVQDILNIGQLVLPFASGMSDPATYSSSGINDERHKQNQHPSQAATQQNHNTGGEKEGEQLLQEFS